MTAYLGRRYRLSAAHRLYKPEWSEQKNRAAFGKCANPHGHGHNYTAEVLLGGPLDPVTGMVADLAMLDRVVEQQVLEPFDHTNLNCLAAFAGQVPTSEVFAMAIDALLNAALPPGLLRQVRLEETVNNTFVVTGPAGIPGRAVLSTRLPTLGASNDARGQQ